MTNTSDETHELEELVIKEAVLSATGLDTDALQIGIKGDPSLRETAPLRGRYQSILDERFNEIGPSLERLLMHQSTYQIFIGFNNAEVRTYSIFDPLREEIHSADKLLDKDYIARHFPEIPFDEKIALMRELYDFIFQNHHYQRVPSYWRKIVDRRHQAWQPMSSDEISQICRTLSALRGLKNYYLRNVTISIVQSIVRMQFNCDGTQIVRAQDFKQFIEENLPD
jgi:hypothetical protein